MGDNIFIKTMKDTGESNKILKPYVLGIDKYVKNLLPTELIYPKFRYYESHHNKNNSKNAYVTMIFGGELYLPAILALGHSLRKVKSKHKLICLVQDKDEYSLSGIKKDKIDEINKIYDLVIGVDIIKIECKSIYFLEMEIFYKNIKYYATKNNVLGLIEYKKIIYLDASCIVNKNIDNIFESYNKSTYKCYNRNDEWELTNHMALHGNFLYIIPSIYNYNKLLIFIKEYDEHIGKYYITYSIDEVMFFYSIYPEWNDNPNKMFDGDIVNTSYKKYMIINKELYYDYEKLKNNSSVFIYEMNKPWRYENSQIYKNTDLENITVINHKPFDEIVKSLINEKPEMLKYFEYIKTFRVVFF
jgi:alpha-N-acetylglucosamine transferase